MELAVLSLMDIAAVLLTLSAIFGWLNHKFLPLSRSVGLLVMSVLTSSYFSSMDNAIPGPASFQWRLLAMSSTPVQASPDGGVRP